MNYEVHLRTYIRKIKEISNNILDDEDKSASHHLTFISDMSEVTSLSSSQTTKGDQSNQFIQCTTLW